MENRIRRKILPPGAETKRKKPMWRGLWAKGHLPGLLLLGAVLLILGLSIAVGILAHGSARQKEAEQMEQALAFEALAGEMESLHMTMDQLALSDGGEYGAGLMLRGAALCREVERGLAQMPMTREGRGKAGRFLSLSREALESMAIRTAGGTSLEAGDRELLRQIGDTVGGLTQYVMDAWMQGYIGEGELDAFLPQGTLWAGIPLSLFENESLQLPDPGVTEQAALQRAQTFLGMELTPGPHGDGQVGTYHFHRQGLEVQVTKQGGHIYSFFHLPAEGVEAKPHPDKVREWGELAGKWLVSKGYPDTRVVQVTYGAGCALFTLVPLEEGILLFPDRLVVWVDMLREGIVGLDASGYVLSHKERTLPVPRISQEEAMERLPEEVQDGQVTGALLPWRGEEIFCWRVEGTFEGRGCEIWIDARDGQQRKILRL